jgi:glycosyltransferase involved in cell wall biosynthesis
MVVGQYYPIAGGTEMECRKLASGLARQGVGVTVLTQHCAGLPDYEEIDGIPVYRTMQGGHLYEYTYMFSVLRFLLGKIRNYDIIHCFGLYLFIPPAILVKYIFGKKVIGRLEGSGMYGDFRRVKQLTCGRLILASARCLDRIISVARHMGAEIAAEGFAERNAVSIPNSVDHELYRPKEKQDQSARRRICFVGRLAEEKGLVSLVEAMQLVRDAISGVTLDIVGDGPMRNELVDRAARLGLQDVIRFTGNSVALQHYHASDLFVLPSFSEGLSLALLEAMACGLPVVATNVEGNREVLHPAGPASAIPAAGYRIGECGILVNPGDVAGLAGAIQRLLTDDDLASRLISRARSRAVATYALDKIINDYRSLYQSLMYDH